MSALARNVMRFAQLLRSAGLPVGAGTAVLAAEALTLVDLRARPQVHAALRAVMVRHRDDFALFDQAFELFWRAPVETTVGPPGVEPALFTPGARRLAEAMGGAGAGSAGDPTTRDDAAMSFNAVERLQQMDFAAMSAADIAGARTALQKLRLPLDERPTRRWRPATSGARLDFGRTVGAAIKTGGHIVSIARRRRQTRPPPLVVLCDISGSMTRYAQVLLHFLHGVAQDRRRISVFLFGTRLTNISRALRHRDPERALAAVAAAVPDWSGGTRIGEVLANFNRLWGRRVLGQGAIVLLVTDGLDRDGAAGLGPAMDRLHRSCRRLIWLNPLLRYEGFLPRTLGARAMLPHVDDFRPVHNLTSLKTLIASLSAPPPRRLAAHREWKDRL
jgi:uncharacterized protein with von Willebrand factor type A (vWA) domain